MSSSICDSVKALYDKVTELKNTYCSVQVVYNNGDCIIEIGVCGSPESLLDALKQYNDEGYVFKGVGLRLEMDNGSTRITTSKSRKSKDEPGYYISVDSGTCFVQERCASLPDTLNQKYLASSVDVFSGVAGQKHLDDLYSLVTSVIRALKEGSILDALDSALSTIEDDYQLEVALIVERTEPAPTVEEELRVLRSELDSCIEDLKEQYLKKGYSVKAVTLCYMMHETSLCELTRYVKEEKYAMHCDLFDGYATFHGEGRTVQEAAENAGDIYKGIWLTDVKQQLERIYELFSRFAW